MIRAKYDPADLAELCRKWQVKKLSVFGSAVRDDFRDDSDVDLAVEFMTEPNWNLWEFFDLREALQSIFGRDVDLVELDAMANPIRKRNILKAIEVIYEA